MSRARRQLTVLALALAVVAFPLGALASHDFADVPDSNLFHADISALVASGVTSGCGGGNYCPSANVTREQMAAFLNRLGALAPGKTPVVNATKLDGLDSSQFLRSDQPTTGHVGCVGWAMTPRESLIQYDDSNYGRYYTSGVGAIECPMVFPDGATVTGIRAGLFDNSALYQASCVFLVLEIATGAMTVAANTGVTGAGSTPGYTVLSAAANVVIDNDAYAYAGQCVMDGATDQLRIHVLSVEYTVTGLPVP